ncbi:MAG: hypothetical protein HYY02_08470 [Chloroflexi bacterium]|nr:hypothetical protein [Chloroflexota bacterium]
MSHLLGLLLGAACCFDALLGLLSPQRWVAMWRDIAVLLPAPADEYVADAVELTETYRAKSPEGLRFFLLLQMAVGLLLLRLGSRE